MNLMDQGMEKLKRIASTMNFKINTDLGMNNSIQNNININMLNMSSGNT